MWKNNKKLSAFTLLECLVALLVLSGGLLVFDGLSRLVVQEVRYQMDNQEKEWQIFSEQFRIELEGSRLLNVENNRLYIQKEERTFAFGQYKADDFRKTDGNGQGYQPMLFHIASSQMSKSDKLVTIHFTFENGMERTFVYDFSKED